jgi:hypothetical protein
MEPHHGKNGRGGQRVRTVLVYELSAKFVCFCNLTGVEEPETHYLVRHNLGIGSWPMSMDSVVLLCCRG